MQCMNQIYQHMDYVDEDCVRMLLKCTKHTYGMPASLLAWAYSFSRLALFECTEIMSSTPVLWSNCNPDSFSTSRHLRKQIHVFSFYVCHILNRYSANAYAFRCHILNHYSASACAFKALIS